ncbi:MAG: deoxyguanosinetriphosphate triphosphohydrolase, partial [Clostridia bacterium]|nr:deoxyguanosinetriphosphate triphosphohydrolase [Clostridia bacterium]
HLREILGKSKGERIDTLVRSTLENTGSGPEIRMDESVRTAFDELTTYMFKNVYTNPVCKGEEGKAVDMLQTMFHYFVDDPERLPEEYWPVVTAESPERAACDYISGMSDRYALTVYQDLFIPRPWAE